MSARDPGEYLPTTSCVVHCHEPQPDTLLSQVKPSGASPLQPYMCATSSKHATACSHQTHATAGAPNIRPALHPQAAMPARKAKQACNLNQPPVWAAACCLVQSKAMTTSLPSPKSGPRPANKETVHSAHKRRYKASDARGCTVPPQKSERQQGAPPKHSLLATPAPHCS